MTGTQELSEFTYNIATAIRAKTGSEELINPQDFASEILNISKVTKKGTISFNFSDNTSYSFDAVEVEESYYYNDEGIGDFDDLYSDDATIVGDFDETESSAEEGENV